jgi:hypothetical protein
MNDFCRFNGRPIVLQELGFFRRAAVTKQFCNANETIFDLGAELRKHRLVNSPPEIGGRRGRIPETVKCDP